MDGRDVRMIQRRKQPRFPLEARFLLFIFEELFGQDLDRNFSPESRVLRPVDLSHAARAEGRKHLIGSQTCSRRDGQSAQSSPAGGSRVNVRH